jgi:hypothetical protein
MHGERHAGRPRRVEHEPRGDDVVALERLGRLAGDLGVQDRRGLGSDERPRPVPWLCQVGLDRLHAGIELRQQPKVVRLLVDRDDMPVACLAQQQHQVLPDQARGPSDDDLVVLVHLTFCGLTWHLRNRQRRPMPGHRRGIWQAYTLHRLGDLLGGLARVPIGSRASRHRRRAASGSAPRTGDTRFRQPSTSLPETDAAPGRRCGRPAARRTSR